MTRRKVQDVKESDADNASGPVVRRTRQNPIIKVCFEEFTQYVYTVYI